MTPITEHDYFGILAGHREITAEIRNNAKGLLWRVNTLLARAEGEGVSLDINPKTRSLISGSSLGGWRPSNSMVGAERSSHKQGRGIDIYDPNDGDLDAWCLANLDALEECGLYMEHPAATKGWCHLTDRAPGSGNRAFYPVTAALNNWFTRWWDFVDDRGIFRRAIVVVSVWMLWDVSKWGMVYADKALEKGIVDASIGAVIAAVGGPATFLVGWVAKIYMDSRKDRA